LAQRWEERYVLLLWLSLICMLPFDMAVLDSGGSQSDVRRIVTCCYRYLAAADKSREAAAIVIARLTTRPDMQKALLPEFLGWARERLGEADPGAVAGMVSLTGVLLALAYVFKLGKRAELLPHAAPLLGHIETNQLSQCPNTLLRKLAAKLVHRLGLTFLPPRLAPWRYQRGKRTLMGGLAPAAATGVGAGVDGEGEAMYDDSEAEYDVPEEVETVLELLLTALKDKVHASTTTTTTIATTTTTTTTNTTTTTTTTTTTIATTTIATTTTTTTITTPTLAMLLPFIHIAPTHLFLPFPSTMQLSFGSVQTLTDLGHCVRSPRGAVCAGHYRALVGCQGCRSDHRSPATRTR
jgi:hypothetical protein